MADHLLATATEIRAELAKLDARRARLRKLLAIAEEDEKGKPPETKGEDKAPDAKPEGEGKPDAKAEVPPAGDVPPPAKAETHPARRPGR